MLKKIGYMVIRAIVFGGPVIIAAGIYMAFLVGIIDAFIWLLERP